MSSTGAFTTVKGAKPLATVRVPARYDDLKMIAYKWQFLEADYMSKKYTVDAMRSTYRRDQVPEGYAADPVQSEVAPQDTTPVVEGDAPIQVTGIAPEAAPEFHHGEMKVNQAFVMKNGTLAVSAQDYSVGGDPTTVYFSWDLADKHAEKSLFERFLKTCKESISAENPRLKEPVPISIMYQIREGKKFFYRFS